MFVVILILYLGDGILATVNPIVYDPWGFGFEPFEIALKDRPKHFDWAYGQGRSTEFYADAFELPCPASKTPAEHFCNTVRKLTRVPGHLREPCQAYSENGQILTSLEEVSDGDSLWLVPNGRLFVWPSVDIHHKQTAHLSDADVEIETLAHEPKLFRLTNFISEEEVEGLVAIASGMSLERSTGGLTKAGVKGLNQGDVTDHRTSTNAWDVNSDIAVRVKKRCFELLRIHNYERTWEDGLQIVHYDPGQFYHSHHDWFDPEGMPEGTYNWDPKTGGANRFATVFIYLSDTDIGGETVFPKAVTEEGWTSDVRGTDAEVETLLGELYPNQDRVEVEMAKECREKLAVIPKKGEAALFYHQDVLGYMDDKALHGACPPLRGDKWGANLWIWNGPIWELEDPELELQRREAVFHNQFDVALELYWIDDNDNFVPLGSVAAGQEFVSNTWVGHRFGVVANEQMVSSWTITEDPDQHLYLSAELNEHASLYKKQNKPKAQTHQEL